MRPYCGDGRVSLYVGDALLLLREMEPCSVDAVVTDPPYGLEFMGSKWDSFRQSIKDFRSNDGYARLPRPVWRGARAGANAAFGSWCETWARECLRVLKPGGHLLAFGGARTYHRLTCGIEDAGFEIRTSLMWVFGSGYPMSLNVGKAIESGGGSPEAIRRMAMGDDYEPSGRGRVNYDHGAGSVMNGSTSGWQPQTEEGARWAGWGTATKPSYEPITVGRKPLAGSVAANVTTHATGALNIDGCRLVTGRWPTNLLLSHTPDCEESCAQGCPVAELDAQSGVRTSGSVGPEGFSGPYRANVYGKYARGEIRPECVYGDAGGASRFFPTFCYEPKAPSSERPVVDGVRHPTVKPLALMRWLVRLVTPPDGLVLDPFAGSGTTLEAAAREGFRAAGIERDLRYVPLIAARMSRDWAEPMSLFEAAS